MKILILAHNNLFALPRGGIKSTQEVIDHLIDCGHECHVIMPGTKTSTDVRYKNYCTNDLLAMKELCLSINPDIFLTWGSMVSITEMFHNDKPWIVFLRSWGDFERYENFEGNIRLASAVIVNSYEGKRRLKEMGIDSVVSYVPVDTDKVQDQAGDKLLFIGLEKINGLHIELAQRIKDEILVVDYDIQPDTVDTIEYLNFQMDVKKVWRKTKIHLFPLPKGGLGTGRTPIEAMAQGIPTICEEGCGAEEVTPWTVPEGASVKQWTKAIKKIKSNYKANCTLAKKYIMRKYSKINHLNTVSELVESFTTEKRALCYVVGGMGNIIEATPALRAISAMGHKIDAVMEPTSKYSTEMLKETKLIDRFYDNVNQLNGTKYDLKMSFHNSVKFIEGCVNPIKDESKAERYWTLDRLKDYGYNQEPKTFVKPSSRFFDIPCDSVVVSPGAFDDVWGFKAWPYYAELSEYFNNVYYVGAKSDVVKCDTSHRNSYIGKLDILDTFALINQASAFIGNDGGLAHAAAALGKPTFIIFGGTSEVKNLPKGAVMIRKSELESCQPCQYTPNFHNCEDIDCMNNLNEIEVINQIYNWMFYNKPELIQTMKSGKYALCG